MEKKKYSNSNRVISLYCTAFGLGLPKAHDKAIISVGTQTGTEMFSACDTKCWSTTAASALSAAYCSTLEMRRRHRRHAIFSICSSVICTARKVCGAGSMQLSGVHPPVRSSVPPGRRSPRLRVCCCGPGGQEISIHCCTAGAQQQPQRSGVMRAVPRYQLT